MSAAPMQGWRRAAALATLAAALAGGGAAAVVMAAEPAGTPPAQQRPAGSAAAQPAAVDHCLGCHTELDGPEAKGFRTDVHFRAGVTCAGCHGGDASKEDKDEAMSPAAGFRGKPRPAAIPEMCGRCHGASASPFKTRHKLGDAAGAFLGGAHGTALKGNAAGPQCVSCHGVHGIAAVSDPRSPVYPTNVTRTCARCHGDPAYMRQFNPGLPVDQYEKYLTSVHGDRNRKGDVRAATCVSCHSNHAIYQVKDPRSAVYPTRVPETCGKCHSDKARMAPYGIPTDQLEKYRQSVHGIALLKNSDLNAPACNSCHGNHGAAPPGVRSVAGVCGTCHQANAELFDKSKHRAAFDSQGLPGCVVCHGNHRVDRPTDSMIGFGKGSACESCHANQPSDPAASIILQTRATLDSLFAGRAEAEKLLSRAEQLGMDIAEARYSLKAVNQAQVESRVKVHAFEKGAVEASAAPGIKVVSAARAAALAAIREYHFRRQGLGVATLIITALVVLLYLKIRQIERRQKHEER
ncbi:MAG: cytochrome c3 family protein [Candidatus Eisenbacteria bacterium]|nr:cytochrome c3 family protein [Candidatus Eisenbacteria bacterium]